MSSNLASSFAPYTPPPDDPSRIAASRSRIWFPHRDGAPASYQSGGFPSSTVAAVASPDIERGQPNEWETTYGFRIDLLSAFAYLLGPISALALLILEVHNDYVRFHAYQSALLMTPLVAVYIIAKILQFPSWMTSFLGVVLCVAGFAMAAQAFLGASGSDLERYHIPKIGELADQWVDEE